METSTPQLVGVMLAAVLFRSFPRKGMETALAFFQTSVQVYQSFPIISPQGDGNLAMILLGVALILTFPIISPQGDGNLIWSPGTTKSETFPIISPQGDGNVTLDDREVSRCVCIFSDHFPARGWKPSILEDLTGFNQLFRSFPRKGMETSGFPSPDASVAALLFRSFPRKGMETPRAEAPSPLSQTFPIISPQGDGNCPLLRFGDTFSPTFPIISPQGDGNKTFDFIGNLKLFRSFPRKGMETSLGPLREMTCPIRHSFPIISPQGDGNS